MTDWVDAFGDAVFQIASSLTDDRTPKQIVGIVFAALTAFFVIGTVVALWLGTKLVPVSWFIAVPMLLISISISIYCLVFGRNGRC